MVDDPETDRLDASKEDAPYALIPIRRDLVAEIDSVRDELSRSEYLRLLIRQTEAHQLDTEHHRTNVSDAGVTTPPRSSVGVTKSQSDNQAAADTTAATNRPPRRSSNGGVQTFGERYDHDGRGEGPPSRDSRSEAAFGDAGGSQTRVEVGTLGDSRTTDAEHGVTDRESNPHNKQNTSSKQASSRSDGGSVRQGERMQSGNQSADTSQHRRRAQEDPRRSAQQSHSRDAAVGETAPNDTRVNHESHNAQFAQEADANERPPSGADAASSRPTSPAGDTSSTGRETTRTFSETGAKRGVTAEAATEPDATTGVLSSDWRLSIGGFIIVWALAVGLYGAGDSVTTIYALASGTAVETNPIVRAAISIHPLMMLLLKLVIIGGLFKLADNLGTRSYPSMDDQLAALIPTILSLIGAYGTFANLQNLNGAMVPYVVLSILLLGFAGGATVALYKGLPLNGKKLKDYGFSQPLSSIQREPNA